MDWGKIHTIQDLLDPTSSDNSEQYDTKRTEANELPFPPLRLTLEDSESNFPTVLSRSASKDEAVTCC